MDLRSEEAPIYNAFSYSEKEEQIIQEALAILYKHMKQFGIDLDSPETTSNFLSLQYKDIPYEMFSILWLTNRHCLIEFEEMFKGTIDGASVHPREIVRRALFHNAAACIVAHNHLSGVAIPSQADKNITQRITDSLKLIDVRVLDHIVIAGTETYSFAENGLL